MELHPVPPARPLARTGAVVGVLSLAVFMSSLDLFIVNLAFPAIARASRGADLGSLSWVLNGYTIVFAAVLVPAGRWADRVGRRRLLVAGMATFVAGSVLCGLVPAVWPLVAARVLQAVGAGLMVPASLSLLLAEVPADRRAGAIGAWSAAGGLGAALGPVIGGGLVELSWRSVFWVNVPVGIAAVVLARRVLAESRDAERTLRPDLIGAGLLTAAVAGVAWALVEAPAWGWGSPRFVGVLVASAVLGALLLARGRWHPAPVIELALLRSVPFSGAFVASVLYYAGFGAFVLESVEFLTGVWHYSPVWAGLAIGPGPLTMLVVARLVTPRLSAVLGGPGRVAAVGAAVNAGAQAWWLGAMPVHPAYVTHLLGPQLLGGAGVGLAVPALLAAGSAVLPPARFGTGSGVLTMARQVGTVLGVAALVAVLAHPVAGHPLVAFRHGVVLVVAFMGAAAVLSAAVLTRRARPAAVGAPAGARTPTADPTPAVGGGAAPVLVPVE